MNSGLIIELAILGVSAAIFLMALALDAADRKARRLAQVAGDDLPAEGEFYGTWV